MALGALTVAHRLKLRVPEDLSVVGFDDTPAGLTAWPPLTPVSQPLEAVGSAVIDALAGGAADTPHFPLRPVQGDSSGPAPACRMARRGQGPYFPCPGGRRLCPPPPRARATGREGQGGWDR